MNSNSNNFEIACSLVGASLVKQDLAHVDYHVFDKLGIFIPSTGSCDYATAPNHTHPSYMISIFFNNELSEIEFPRKHHIAAIMSPNIPCNIDV